MNFSIDQNRLATFQNRFKAANAASKIAFAELQKAEANVATAERSLSAIDRDRRDRAHGVVETRDAAAHRLAEAEKKLDAASDRYVEASRVSGYHGALVDRCQRHADERARSEGAKIWAKAENDAEAASRAAHADKVAAKAYRREHTDAGFDVDAMGAGK